MPQNKRTEAEDFAQELIDSLLSSASKGAGGVQSVRVSERANQDPRIIVKFSDGTKLNIKGMTTEKPSLPTCPPIPK